MTLANGQEHQTVSTTDSDVADDFLLQPAAVKTNQRAAKMVKNESVIKILYKTFTAINNNNSSPCINVT